MTGIERSSCGRGPAPLRRGRGQRSTAGGSGMLRPGGGDRRWRPDERFGRRSTRQLDRDDAAGGGGGGQPGLREPDRGRRPPPG